jgi:signal transduction histidine kinase
VIEEVSGLFKERAKRQNIEFKCIIDSKDGKFEADRLAVRSLLLNLLDNSLDACRVDKKKSDHSIIFETKSEQENIIFQVTDNGIGMDRETREKALSLFFSSKGSGGTGLGLFIANKIAQSHGGAIDIQSKENEGSKFIVTLLKKRPSLNEQVDP